MVTRKAIVTAFETIVLDKEMKSITVFCGAKNIPLLKTERVRVTRLKRSPKDFRVTLGRMNYVERAYAQREAAAKRTPKVMMTWTAKKKAKA